MKTKTAFLLLLVISIGVVALLLLRARAPKAPSQIVASHIVPAETHPIAKPHAATRAPTQSSTGTTEICGFGQVEINSDNPDAATLYAGRIAKVADAQWLSALQNSGDLRGRAAGLLLANKLNDGEPLQAVPDQALDQIIQLAAGTTDPAVYATAVSMCSSYSPAQSGSACQTISLQRWAQIDPNNAVPWLLIANEARHNNDFSGEADAFAQAVHSTKVDSYNDSLYAFAEPELPADITPLQRTYLAIEVIGVEAAMPTPQYALANQHCSADAMRDRKVLQECKDLAELLVSKGSTLMDLSLGRLIGTRSGWTRARLDEITQQQNALRQVVSEVTSSEGNDFWTCASVNRVNAYTAQRARLGEVGAANELLERSGKTLVELAQKYRQNLEAIQLEVQKQQQGSSATPSQ